MGAATLGCDLVSSAAHLASKCSASWELGGGVLLGCNTPSGGQPLLLLPPLVVPFCMTVVVETGMLCGRPLTVGGVPKGGVGNPLGWALGNVWWWCPPLSMVPVLGPVPPPMPIEAPLPADPAAVQNTLATIWDGVMPTTGALALGYVMLLARAGM